MKKKLIVLITMLCALFAVNVSAQKVSKTAGRTKAPFSSKIRITSSTQFSNAIMWNVINPYAMIPINTQNGSFTYTFSATSFAKASKNDVAQIAYGDKDLFVILDSPNIQVNLDTEEVKGSATTDKLSGIIRQIQQASSKAEANEIALSAIHDNQNNPIAQVVLKLKMRDFDYSEMQRLLAAGGSYLDSPICNKIKTLVQRAPGQKMKDLELKDTLGMPHKLSEYIHKGQYTLIDFWASWCKPCLAEMPYVKANYQKYKDAGFCVIGVSLDNNAELWKKSIRQNDFGWIHLSDLQGWKTVAQKAYGLVSIPANVLCDGDGNIIATDLRQEKLDEKLSELYGK